MAQKAKQDAEKSEKPPATVREKETKTAATPSGEGEREGGGGVTEGGEADLGRGDIDQSDQKYYGKRKGV